MANKLCQPVGQTRGDTMNARVTLVLGGAGSGKSLYAENLISSYPTRLYVATASARDDDMNARIRKHQLRRGPEWKLVEEPLKIAEIINRNAKQNRPILLDCLTLWLANILETGDELGPVFKNLADTLETVQGPVVLVSNEVGLGGVAANAQMRQFMDFQGRLNQVIAKAAGRVILVVAGLPIILKENT